MERVTILQMRGREVVERLQAIGLDPIGFVDEAPHVIAYRENYVIYTQRGNGDPWDVHVYHRPSKTFFTAHCGSSLGARDLAATFALADYDDLVCELAKMEVSNGC